MTTFRPNEIDPHVCADCGAGEWAHGPHATCFDYPAAARSIMLNLKEFVDETKPAPIAIADAARKAGQVITELRRIVDRSHQAHWGNATPEAAPREAGGLDLELEVVADNPQPQEGGPEWTCCGCGEINRCRTVQCGSPMDPPDYDLECLVCGSNEFEENPQLALKRVIEAFEKATEKLDDAASLAGPHATVEGHVFDYPAAARSIMLNLSEFCDDLEPVPLSIANGARKARHEIDRLRERLAQPAILKNIDHLRAEGEGRGDGRGPLREAAEQLVEFIRAGRYEKISNYSGCIMDRIYSAFHQKIVTQAECLERALLQPSSGEPLGNPTPEAGSA